MNLAFVPVSPEFNITATVTDDAGNTSEFSAPFPVSYELADVGSAGLTLR